MLREYFTSLYFTFLRRKLQKMRLRFFMDIEVFGTAMEHVGLGYSAGESLDNLSLLFPKVVQTITEIEAIEKKMNGGDTFRGDTYISLLYRDMLTALSQVEQRLKGNYRELQEAKESLMQTKTNNGMGSGNIHLHEITAQTLSEKLEQAIAKLSTIIEQLGQDYEKYGKDFPMLEMEKSILGESSGKIEGFLG